MWVMWDRELICNPFRPQLCSEESLWDLTCSHSASNHWIYWSRIGKSRNSVKNDWLGRRWGGINATAKSVTKEKCWGMIQIYNIRYIIPSPACLFSEQIQIVRRPNNATQRAGWRRAQLCLSPVSEMALPACTMPTTVLITRRPTLIYELTTGFNCRSVLSVHLSVSMLSSRAYL